MKTGYTVGDVMTNKPVTGGQDLTLKEAALLMEKEDVNSLLIVQDQKAIGIITDEDIVRKAVAKGLDPKKLRLKDVMESSLISITPEKDIYAALLLMRENNIRQVPVIQRGVLLGFLTTKDVLKIEPELIDLLVEKYELRGDDRRFIDTDEEVTSIIKGKNKKKK